MNQNKLNALLNLYLEAYLFRKVPLSKLKTPLPSTYDASKVSNYIAIFDGITNVNSAKVYFYSNMPTTTNGWIYPILPEASIIHSEFPKFLEEKTKNIKSAAKLLVLLNDMKVNNEQNSMLIELEKGKIDSININLQASLQSAKTEQDRILSDFNIQKEKNEKILAEKDAYISSLKNKSLENSPQVLSGNMGTLPFDFFNEVLTDEFFEPIYFYNENFMNLVKKGGEAYSDYMNSPSYKARDYIIFNFLSKSGATNNLFINSYFDLPMDNPPIPYFSDLFALTQIDYSDVDQTSLDPYVQKILKKINYNLSNFLSYKNTIAGDPKKQRAFDFLYKKVYEGYLNSLFLGEYKNLLLDQKEKIIEAALQEIQINSELDNYVTESTAILDRLNTEKTNAVTLISQLQEAMLQAKLKFEKTKVMSTTKEEELNALRIRNDELTALIKKAESDLATLMKQFEEKQARLLAEEVARQLEIEKAEKALNILPIEEAFSTAEEVTNDSIQTMMPTPEVDAINDAVNKSAKIKKAQKLGLGLAVAYGLYSLLG